MSIRNHSPLRILGLAAAFAVLFGAMPCAAGEPEKKILYVYDEVNEQSSPYIANFRAALSGAGIAFDEVTAAELASGKAAVNH